MARRRLSVAAAVFCGAFLSGIGAVLAADIKIASSAPGNIFAPGEDVTFEVETSVPRLSWQVTDFDGGAISHGDAAVRGGRGTISLPAPGTGYYTVSVSAPEGAPSMTVPFAVIPPPSGSAKDTRFGVVTHFALGWNHDILPLVARAGIAGIRDEEPWQAVEPSRENFSFPLYLDGYVTSAHKLGIDVLVPLTYANPLYDDGQTPFSDAGRAAYARYAEAVVRHFEGRAGAVEIWNEYNGAFADGPVLKDRPRFYGEMLKTAYRGIKSVRRAVPVVGGGVAGIPLPYFKRLFDDGALADMDVVQIHPYFDVPEDAEYDVADLRRMLDARSSGGRKAIWATEVGSYGPHDGRRQTAEDLVRLYVVLLSEGVERIYWYLLRDDPEFPSAGLLENTGIAGSPYAPAPAYASYATLIQELRNARFRGRDIADAQTRIYRFGSPDGTVRVAWSLHGPTQVTLQTTRDVTVVSVDGRRQVIAPSHGRIDLTLTDSPIFIRGPLAAVTLHRADEIVADSSRGFSDRQGLQWFYGSEAVGAPGDGATAGSFHELQWSNNDWGYFWADPALAFLMISRFVMHPSLRDDRPVAAVRRWLSHIGGHVRVSGTAERSADLGDGVRFEVRLDGRTVYSAALGTPGYPKRCDFSLPLELRKGSTLDFAVFPVSSKLDFDTTTFRAIVTARSQAGG